MPQPVHRVRSPLRRTVSVVLAENADGKDRSLSCFGALEVIMQRGQPEFRTFHLTSSGMGGPAALCERLAQICSNRHIILGQPAIRGDFWDNQDLLSVGSLFMSSIRPHEDLQPSGMSAISLSSVRLKEISERMKLQIVRQTRSQEAERLAPDRAQLLWLGYIEAQTRKRISDGLFAAFQAWNAIEKARPLPF